MQNRIKFGICDTEDAVARSELVLAPIRQAFPAISAELVTMDAAGHRFQDTKALENALMEGWVDFVIYPLDALPVELSRDLPLVAYTRRLPQEYAFVLAEHAKKLPKSKPIGCFTVLQQLQLQKQYPKHEILLMNETPQRCLRLFHTGAIGGLVLERTQIETLDLTARIYHRFTGEELVPAAGAGILAVQTRRGTDCGCLKVVGDLDTAYCALAERSFLRCANGDPALTGAYARLEGGQLILTGITARQDQPPKAGDIFGNPQQAAMLGEMLAGHLD